MEERLYSGQVINSPRPFLFPFHFPDSSGLAYQHHRDIHDAPVLILLISEFGCKPVYRLQGAFRADFIFQLLDSCSHVGHGEKYGGFILGKDGTAVPVVQVDVDPVRGNGLGGVG